ncbi:hypothetical protein [Bartonella apihabitans]|uniref:hypothetical protein n=1 Tax=Bartonella apihabitans TaxID=2750929 RepID=UPI003BB5C7F4
MFIPIVAFKSFDMKTLSLTYPLASSDKEDKCLWAQKPEGTALAHDDSGLAR